MVSVSTNGRVAVAEVVACDAVGLEGRDRPLPLINSGLQLSLKRRFYLVNEGHEHVNTSYPSLTTNYVSELMCNLPACISCNDQTNPVAGHNVGSTRQCVVQLTHAAIHAHLPRP